MTRFGAALLAGCPAAEQPVGNSASRATSAHYGGAWLAGNVECRNTVQAVGVIDQQQADRIEATGRIAGAK